MRVPITGATLTVRQATPSGAWIDVEHPVLTCPCWRCLAVRQIARKEGFSLTEIEVQMISEKDHQR